MKYEIRVKPDGTPLLYRNGKLAKPDGGLPNNSALEFWHEIETLRSLLGERTIALRRACDLAQAATLPSLGSLNQWRVALGGEKLPDDFEF